MAQIITRYLGIDYGSKRIGLALGDSASRVAVPFGVVPDLESVLKVIEEEGVDELVIGLPFTMTSGQGEMAQAVNRFTQELIVRTGLPVKEIDERLTSKGADALAGNKKVKAERDAIAAMLILQSYLDEFKV